MTLGNIGIGGSTDTLVASAAKTTTAAATGVAGFGSANTLIVQLACTASGGTNPTLDVLIQSTIDGTNWFLVDTFTQIVTTGVAIRSIPKATQPWADIIRASWTIGGTNTPTFTISVKCFSNI
jgi:hypothetical protein